MDHFDWLAPLYDRVIQAPQDDTLSHLLNLPVRGWLLDAAGGTGRTQSRDVSSPAGSLKGWICHSAEMTVRLQ